MVYIKDIGEFIKFIITERIIDPLSTIVRVVADLVKITMNVFNPSDNINTLTLTMLESSVVLLFCYCRKISELNGNLRKFLDPLDLQNIKYYVAFHFKCANSMFSILSDAGKYRCLCCEGEHLLDAGEK